ncbi:hypothetical protein PSTT_05082 [Puccinia striiformis]|uniref:Prenyltransferase alpha-alpha toroid domain-containing protein n=1 Tax=Puccinia striiformis TaxID=27350 RepID=A0A2S4VQE6_9BASI|nr:hypothetical protein PSTT_05082 [Puccinia striiformis]
MVSDLPEEEQGFARPSHIRYALRHLRMLPSPYQSDDSNRITFGFFALSSLAILGALDRLDLTERANYIDWIYRRWNHKIGGFGGAPNIDLRGLGPDEEPCDHPHLAHTYTALLILALLTLPSNERPEPESPYELSAAEWQASLRRINSPAHEELDLICSEFPYSFGSFPDGTDEDVRFVYCAIAILAMIRVDPGKVIDVNSTERFLKSCRRYEGGYGQAPHCEAQGGTTYCALASLALLGRLESSQTEEEADQTVRWLVDRQGEVVDSSGISPERDIEDAAKGSQPTARGPGIPSLPHESNKLSGTNDQPTPIDGVPPTSRRTVAGFQGRIGKPLDACYSFWCTAGLTIMSRRGSTQDLNLSTSHHNPSAARHCLRTDVEDPISPPVLYDPHANIQFLLRCQSSQWGGIARSPGDHPATNLRLLTNHILIQSNPDVYHTYLALASLSLSNHSAAAAVISTLEHQVGPDNRSTGDLDQLLTLHDPLLNVPLEVSKWIFKCFAPKKST